MSLYNMIYGVSPVTFFILPVLGKHPDWYPRFRDAFISDPERPETEGKLIVYTRTGGGNRDAYEDRESYKQAWGSEPDEGQTFNSDIRELPGFLFDYDDDFDNTFANFVFDIPPQWKDDVDKLVAGKGFTTSDAYVEMILATFPKIADKLRDALRPPELTVAPEAESS